MKRLLFVLPFLCLAADQPSIEGWTVKIGKWSAEKGIIRSDGGEPSTLASNTLTTDDFALTFNLKVFECRQPGLVGAYVCHGGGGGADHYQFMVNTAAGKMSISRWGSEDQKAKVLCEQPCPFPRDRSIPITIARKGSELLFRAGKIKLIHNDPAPPEGKMISLHSNDVVAEFARVKLTTK